MSREAPERFEVRVVSVDVVAEGVLAFEVEDPQGDPLPSWTPGAHIEVHLDNGLVRHYSLCSPPEDRSRWRIAVLRDEAGTGGSRHLHESVGAGDIVSISGPHHRFPLVDAPEYLFIAGGIGITPLWSMIREVAQRGASWRLIFGGRRRSAMAFADELERHGDLVTIMPQDELGLPDLASEIQALSPHAVVFACGPPAMLDALNDAAAGLEPGRVHMEKFTAGSGANADVGGEAFDVILSRSGRTLRVGDEESILDVLEREAVDVVSSCREGICGTCETAVQGGIPLHLDDVLLPEERERGDTMMVCVSRAITPTLTLDL